MRKFFSGRAFKIIAGVVCVLLVISVLTSVFGDRIAPQSDLLSAVLSPLQAVGSGITRQIDRFFTAVGRLDTLEEENNRLREEIRTYRQELVDFDDYKRENEFYKDFLSIKQQNDDFAFQPATIIARDGADVCAGFSINVGTRDGIAVHDPVITADGLVGYISEVGTTMSTVVTVIDPNLHVGALVSRTKEAGMVSGDTTLLAQGACRLSYLSGTSAVTIGDTVITSGAGGVFPAGLIVGTVTDVKKEQANVSLYAVVQPFVDVNAITQVMVITDFEGQGGIGDE